MVERVPAEFIEVIVGVKRHPTDHYGRAVSQTQTTYVLHSQQCKDAGTIETCKYAVAQERGISVTEWVQDEPVRLRVEKGRLVPREANKS
jgi:hypothetical protein